MQYICSQIPPLGKNGQNEMAKRLGLKVQWFNITRLLYSNSVSNLMYSFSRYIKLLKPSGHVMHQQFNIQQLYALPTLYLCVLYLSENKQRLVPLTA